jgi:hypothetical protein
VRATAILWANCPANPKSKDPNPKQLAIPWFSWFSSLFSVFFGFSAVNWQFRFCSFPIFRFVLQLSASQRFSFLAFSLLRARREPRPISTFAGLGVGHWRPVYCCKPKKGC